MHSKLLKRFSPFVVAALVTGCGAPAPEAPAETTPPETVTPADVGTQEQEMVSTIMPGETVSFPSWWPGSTKVYVESYGTQFQPTDVHMYCTTGEPENDIWFTLYAGQVQTFVWSCFGRSIHVHNLGTNEHQIIRVITE
ncbi:hypothetical protein ACLESO_40310 [Pyxidicoccus sp. 3LG]